VDPALATGDGALGFWAALAKVYPGTRAQRCWVHKTANVLNRLPKSVQPKATQMLHAIWMAETRADAQRAFALFLDTFKAKYEGAVLHRFSDLTRTCSPELDHPTCGMRTACAHAQEAPVLYLSSLVRSRPTCRDSSTRVLGAGLPGGAARADAGLVAPAQS
jgi:hypothetical protein